MNLLERKKLQKNIKGIIETNNAFHEYLDSMSTNYQLNTNDEENIMQLQEHLNNMTVIFRNMNDNVRKNKG